MVLATDDDTNPDYRKVNYKFKDVPNDIAEYFELDLDGIFFLKKSIKGSDREFVFKVTAFDNPTDLSNSREEVKTITIKITKDYPPKFPGNSDSKDLEENMLETFEFTIATDQNNVEDGGMNDIICYYLLNQTEYFQIPHRTKNEINVLLYFQVETADWGFKLGNINCGVLSLGILLKVSQS